MTKLERIEKEIEKNKGKIQELQDRNKELEAQHTEEENAVIIQMVRKNKIPVGELGAFLAGKGDTLTNPSKTPPVPLDEDEPDDD